MSRFEIRPTTGTHVGWGIREDAPNEAEAVAQAMDRGLLADGDELTIEPAEELPIGFYGDDPEADAHDVGDFV